MTSVKTCSRCSETKSLLDFPKAKTCVDGRRSYCKACDKQRKDEWRSKNLDKHNVKSANWRKNNPEKMKAFRDAYNKACVLSGKSAEAKRAWRKRNLHLAKADVNFRREKFKHAMPKWVNCDELRNVYEAASEQGLTVDHIVPIKHSDVCGLHVPWNLQILTLEENMKKSNTFNGVATKRAKNPDAYGKKK